MLVQVLGVLAGLIILPLAADHLVLGAASLAQLMRLPPAIVGVVVIGLGTSAPEFVVSGTAAATGNGGIAAGNLVGSNILNITLVLGVAALFGTITATSTVINREVTVATVCVAVFAAAITIGLNLWTGLMLCAFGVGAVTLLMYWARTDRTDTALTAQTTEFTAETPAAPAVRAIREIPRTAAGLAAVLIAAQLLVTNAAAIATHFGVPQLIIGATLVALGTSIPELVAAIQARRRGETDLLIGNIFGSNLFNSLIGGGIVGLFTGPAHSVTIRPALALTMLTTAVLAWLLLRRDLRLTIIEAALLLAAYTATLPLVLTT
ncbi:sodium:calcium antiporter [Nocardia veterana]|uniref:Sodium:calcium antiporter n=1 Tax=Nocardia veterana TaxID=132249 RepID=A0A7X6M3B5_9NOCA|nr:sodium:calcium antiporter [Nocardia veterana]